ncbi:MULTISPECIES: sugar ABC transporter ATP-binding protein [unclassified Rhizobium]|uniref:sugar ABC transporter ATP-binding protein n=1 Tax=unclassified Rhizobium TaxID=2613769 RepID=UPI001AD9EEE1|nr:MULTISPECIES: sugar ABC transporter ATP-binding protein [unclassified Rhizobium]MBO9101268.1 sugar ABC transporter ATP-binding protein [Rhizobium sp. L58/93]MBO9134542.1 sugar ABC transporter ATP-binding protein [Rhizobium sp. B209b/85]MBO9171827.1 sugar ABC transporter ATP-binding protein [Rhizobium sp. L245/93]MBO9182708.1 sugar ABC transporter ATP-binding protein [Rhizobium sp. E27B/91]QXZ86434.1 sugar ABC transporter ATP-binding protein [Rhizobium sp. K1/93]
MHEIDSATAGSRPLLSLRDINITFGGVHALKNVSFDVLPGEVHCLAGENGSGKSTLIKIITGVYRPAPGAIIEFDGQAYPDMSPVTAQTKGIQVIWQDLALFPEMTVAENIAFQTVLGRWPRFVNYRHMRRLALSALKRLGVDLNIDLPLKEFPIAQRQIVAIARALVGEAKIVFMDEPTASLTQSETDHLLNIVRTLSADGVSVVFVSHRLAEVLEISSRLTVLRDGALVGAYSTEGMTQSRITELMTGKNFDNHLRATLKEDQPTVLEVKSLSRRGQFENISLTVRRGETLGITGLLGAGRTELALALFGMNRPDSGTVTLEGSVVRFSSNRDAIDAGIAYLSEDRLSLGLIQPQSIADNLVISSLYKIRSGGFLSDKKKHDLVAGWIRELGVKIGLQEDAISTLSGGNQQRIAIAKWLATEPKLLILDSPTVGVDVGARAGIFEIVAKLAKTGLAIILISDEVPEVYFNADRVLHMAKGEIVGSFDPRHCSLQEIEAAVYA